MKNFYQEVPTNNKNLEMEIYFLCFKRVMKEILKVTFFLSCICFYFVSVYNIFYFFINTRDESDRKFLSVTLTILSHVIALPVFFIFIEWVNKEYKKAKEEIEQKQKEIFEKI